MNIEKVLKTFFYYHCCDIIHCSIILVYYFKIMLQNCNIKSVTKGWTLIWGSH